EGGASQVDLPARDADRDRPAAALARQDGLSLEPAADLGAVQPDRVKPAGGLEAERAIDIESGGGQCHPVDPRWLAKRAFEREVPGGRGGLRPADLGNPEREAGEVRGQAEGRGRAIHEVE